VGPEVAYQPHLRFPRFGKYGDFSYGIYIFQFPVFTLCFVLTKQFGLPWNSRLTFLVCCAILICISSVSFELIEKPLRRAGMQRYLGRP